jgi:hypothetical protein
MLGLAVAAEDGTIPVGMSRATLRVDETRANVRIRDIALTGDGIVTLSGESGSTAGFQTPPFAYE